jgi:Tfp pilus assembly protein PilZ
MTKVRKAQIFTGKDNILAAHLFFIPDSQEPQKLTSKHLDIIFPGLPQSPCFHQLESLVTEDRSILYVHYYGSWYSGGIFTPSNTGETVRDLLTLCKTRLAKDEYTNQIIIIEPENITLVGNSFGGHFVYQNESQEITHNVVLISPLLAVSPTNLTLDSSFCRLT